MWSEIKELLDEAWPLLAITLTLFACAFLSGCAAPISVPPSVNIPVAVGCVVDRVSRPAFKSDAEYKATADAATALDALWIERKERQVYEGKLEAVQAGCPDAPPPTE
jgi:hypothetical protein